MYKNTFIFTILLLAIAVVAGEYISGITVDATSGKIFVLESAKNPILYELDNSNVEQDDAHRVQGAADLTASTNSLFIRKKGAQSRSLFIGFEGENSVNLTVDSFKLPLGGQNTLRYTSSAVVGAVGTSLDPSFDTASSFAIYSASRNLNIVDLNTLAVTDSMYYWGNRIAGRNVVRNNNNQRVVIFYTAESINGPYGLSVDEFDVSTGKFKSVSTTYKCQCAQNPEQSPFYHVVLDEANCQMNYATNTIWCSSSEASKLYSFQANDLSKYKIFSVATPFTTVVWDFSNNRAYGLMSSATSFVATKINLDNGNVITSKTVNGIHIDEFVHAVDPSKPRLYVSVFSAGESVPTKIVWINTDTLAAHEVTLTAPAKL